MPVEPLPRVRIRLDSTRNASTCAGNVAPDLGALIERASESELSGASISAKSIANGIIMNFLARSILPSVRYGIASGCESNVPSATDERATESRPEMTLCWITDHNWSRLACLPSISISFRGDI